MEIVSRDEYLAYRLAWKTIYRELSEQIRVFKVATQMTAKKGITGSNILQSMRAKDSNYARFLMDELNHFKEVSRVSVQFMRFLQQSNNPGTHDDSV